MLQCTHVLYTTHKFSSYDHNLLIWNTHHFTVVEGMLEQELLMRNSKGMVQRACASLVKGESSFFKTHCSLCSRHNILSTGLTELFGLK